MYEVIKYKRNLFGSEVYFSEYESPRISTPSVQRAKLFCCLMSLHAMPGEFENGGITALKTHQMFSVITTRVKFKMKQSPVILDVFEENSVRDIT